MLNSDWQADRPVLSYLGMHLTDLMFIDQGNPDILPGTNVRKNESEKSHTNMMMLMLLFWCRFVSFCVILCHFVSFCVILCVIHVFHFMSLFLHFPPLPFPFSSLPLSPAHQFPKTSPCLCRPLRRPPPQTPPLHLPFSFCFTYFPFILCYSFRRRMLRTFTRPRATWRPTCRPYIHFSIFLSLW